MVLTPGILLGESIAFGWLNIPIILLVDRPSVASDLRLSMRIEMTGWLLLAAVSASAALFF